MTTEPVRYLAPLTITDGAAILERATAHVQANPDDYGKGIADGLALTFRAALADARFREQQRAEMEATRLRDEPFPVYYDTVTSAAIRLAQEVLAEDAVEDLPPRREPGHSHDVTVECSPIGCTGHPVWKAIRAEGQS